MTLRQEAAATAGRIQDDMATVGVKGTLGVFSLHEQAWICGGRDQPDEVAADFGSSGFVVALFNSQHLVGGGIDSASVDWVDVLSFVQDLVMDELGHGWPELYNEGRFVAVLEPGLADGRLVWMQSGQALVAVGSLISLPSETVKSGP